MKKLRITFTLMLLVLGCFSLSPAVKAEPRPTPGPRPFADGRPIVGLWDVIYTSDFGPSFETHDQWFSDGLEFEINSLAPGTICQGTWKQTADRAIHLHHVGFTFGVAPCPGTARLEETQLITVSLDRNSYEGRYHQQFLDANGNLVCEDTGTVQATRISVNQ